MAQFPIESSRLTLIATGKCRPVALYAENAAGEKVRVPGAQETDERTKLPVWTVDVQLDDDEAARAEAIGVKVSAAQEPRPAKWQPITFENLVCTPWVDKRANNQLKFSMRATGIVSAPVGRSAAAKSEG
jgi:hypothetical protein